MAEENPNPKATSDQEDKNKELNRWKGRISRAKKLREDWETEYKVKELENFYLGKQGNDNQKVFNHFLATLKAEQPELFFTNPTFLVRPKPRHSGPAEDSQVNRAQGVLQSIAGHDDNLEISGELATAQAYFRIGVLKCVYDPALEPNPQAKQPVMQHQADGSPVIDENTGEPAQLVDPMTGQPVIEPDYVLSDEVYRWEWVDSRRMLLPDEGPDMRRWGWVGEEVVVPLGDAKADIRFPDNLRSQLKANVTKDPERDRTESKPTEPEEEELFKYAECYDLKAKRWYCYADGQDFDEFLINDVLPAGVEDHPYAILPGFNPIQGPSPSPWPLPEVASWRPIQEEYNIRRNQITEGCKRSARKIGYDEGTFADETEALKYLQSSRDMEGVKLQTTAHPPVPIDEKSQSPDLYNDVALLLSDWQRITGQTGANLGKPDANTATEAAFTQRASNARTVQKRNQIIRWMRSAGRKMLQLVCATMTVNIWVQIRGLQDKDVAMYAEQVYGVSPVMLAMLPGLKDIMLQRFGQQRWVEAKREEITFESEVDIVPGSVRPRTLDLERQEWLELLKIIGSFPQLLLSRELLMETAKRYETITEQMVDELVALAPKLVMLMQSTAGRNGDNSQGGGSGPTPEQNTLTAMAGAVQ